MIRPPVPVEEELNRSVEYADREDTADFDLGDGSGTQISVILAVTFFTVYSLAVGGMLIYMLWLSVQIVLAIIQQTAP